MVKDIIHDRVKNALENDRWTITHDPFPVQYKEITMYADLGAERPIAAERDNQKIVVEIKSFIKRSPVQDLKEAIGQYVIYQSFLAETEPERKLYLAISEKTFQDLFKLQAVQLIINRYAVLIIVVNLNREEIVKWIS